MKVYEFSATLFEMLILSNGGCTLWPSHINQLSSSTVFLQQGSPHIKLLIITMRKYEHEITLTGFKLLQHICLKFCYLIQSNQNLVKEILNFCDYCVKSYVKLLTGCVYCTQIVVAVMRSRHNWILINIILTCALNFIFTFIDCLEMVWKCLGM